MGANKLPVYAVLCLVLGFCRCTSPKEMSLEYNSDSQKFTVHNYRHNSNDAVGWSLFENAINKTGWAYYEVHTSEKFPDAIQAYAAGVLEGLATRELIDMFWFNTMDGYCTHPLSDYCQRLQNYLDENASWMQSQIEAMAHRDAYWHQVELFLDQLQGLIDAYELGKPGLFPRTFKPDVTSLYMLQISGDLEDLETCLNKPERVHTAGSGHCSALIKLLPGNKDLYVAQDTWTSFNTMLRIMKLYDLPFHAADLGTPVVPGSSMSFSSYPGVIYSGDDIYNINSGLVTLETTIGNGNSDRWKYVKANGTVLEGIRNMVANRLAADGKAWSDIFSMFNSGTYNNQWMVVDFNKFTSGEVPDKGLLYVLEQIPGMIVSHDVTNVLTSQTYWPSYNTAYFPEIFNASGGPEDVAKYGDWFSYDMNPRAQIFRRDHSKVTDVDSMTKLMRYNDFTHDPLSVCNCTPPYSSENAISARCDLNPINGTYPFNALGHRNHGATDMKLTTSALVARLEFIAVSSPTYDDVPPFVWSKSDYKDSVRHLGHPDVWQFKPEIHQWTAAGV